MPGMTNAHIVRLRQWAVYWQPLARTGTGGATFAEPVEIRCRWSEKGEMFLDPSGQQVLSNAIVWPDRALAIGGYLMLGRLTDLESGDVTPTSMHGRALVIRGTSSEPDRMAVRFWHKVWLRIGRDR